MLIEDKQINLFIEDTLKEIQIDFKKYTHSCYHCGMPIMYPLIAREQDIEDFKLLIRSAEVVMEKYGITFNLLAEIKAECLIEIARGKALNE